MDSNRFSEIMKELGSTEEKVDVKLLLHILAGIINTSDKNNDAVKQFAEDVKDRPTEEIVSKTVLFTCNSIVINLHNFLSQAKVKTGTEA